MKISLIIFLLTFLSPSFFSQSLITNNQLLWQISGNGLKKNSYLFGSYHSNDARVFKLSDSTNAAFLNAEAVVLEADIYQLFAEYDMRLKEVNLDFDSNGKAFTSDTKPTQTKYGNEDGRPQFLDLYFQQMAYNMGKAFFPLETVEEQIEAFESVYERTATQKNLQDLKIVQDNLFYAYLKGDIEKVRSIIQNQLNDSKNAYDRLIVKRNINMVNGIDTLCRNKSLFVAVGCGHLAGNDGIITLLRKKGYIVRQVFASYSSIKTEAEQKIAKFNKFTYFDKKEKFTAVFGGKPIMDTNVNYFRLIYQEMGQGNTFVIEIENSQNDNLAEYAADVIDLPEKSNFTELKHQNSIQAFEGVGYEYAAGLSWKRIFIVNGKLIKLICYGGNKFMNSNRPQAFFNKVIFEPK